jgi:hypothetical protein
MLNDDAKFDPEKFIGDIKAFERAVVDADRTLLKMSGAGNRQSIDYKSICCIVCMFACFFSLCLIVISDKQLGIANERVELYRELQNTKTSDLQREISILRGRVDVLRAQVDKR